MRRNKSDKMSIIASATRLVRQLKAALSAAPDVHAMRALLAGDADVDAAAPPPMLQQLLEQQRQQQQWRAHTALVLGGAAAGGDTPLPLPPPLHPSSAAEAAMAAALAIKRHSYGAAFGGVGASPFFSSAMGGGVPPLAALPLNSYGGSSCGSGHPQLIGGFGIISDATAPPPLAHLTTWNTMVVGGSRGNAVTLSPASFAGGDGSGGGNHSAAPGYGHAGEGIAFSEAIAGGASSGGGGGGMMTGTGAARGKRAREDAAIGGDWQQQQQHAHRSQLWQAQQTNLQYLLQKQ